MQCTVQQDEVSRSAGNGVNRRRDGTDELTLDFRLEATRDPHVLA
jgi:hypothetical protein